MKVHTLLFRCCDVLGIFTDEALIEEYNEIVDTGDLSFETFEVDELGNVESLKERIARRIPD